MIQRTRHLTHVERLLDESRVVAILGARQVGKTTLARQIADRYDGPVLSFDLEDPDDLARIEEPKLAFGDHEGLIVIDEIQRRPELFPVLRVLVDRSDNPARFLVLGSSSPDLLRQTAETLAGRIAYHRLGGFSLDEVGREHGERLWIRGGFPLSFLAADDAASLRWRENFIATFLERDIPQLGFRVPGPTLHRFWSMLAHYHGQVWNGAELARAFGVSESTVRNYLDILSGALVLDVLQPWHENLRKRQVKSPKVYLSDTGLLHALLGLETARDIGGHPKVGASWESFVLGELVAHLGVRREDCHFWATYSGAELDLLIVRGNRRLGVEIKRTTSPRTTKSMHAAIESLGLDGLWVIHAGEHDFPMTDNINAVALDSLATMVFDP
ncbi:ATP-binding protein [bacterium]|nr:ATP-binding protein [bacterium]